MLKDKLFPNVVPLSYFDLPPGTPEPTRPGAFGFVEPVGQHMAKVLVAYEGDFLKNVHEEDLNAAALSEDEAWGHAIDNLTALIKQGGSFKAEASQTPSGMNYVTWIGRPFAASCMLWPGLHGMIAGPLNSQRILLCAPSSQLLFLCSEGNAEFRGHMSTVCENMAAKVEDAVSTNWMLLTESGLETYVDAADP